VVRCGSFLQLVAPVLLELLPTAAKTGGVGFGACYGWPLSLQQFKSEQGELCTVRARSAPSSVCVQTGACVCVRACVY
jgi:hypothetical protein